MNYQARFNKKGNIKVGTIWTWSKVYGNAPIHTTQYGDVVGTCGNHCDGCMPDCYVRRSYRYDSVKNGHARNTIAFRTDIEGSFRELVQQIERAKNKPEIVRINQSGEIETALELLLWVRTAARFPSVKFYLYTKNFNALRQVIADYNDGVTMPDNITVLISVWHQYGIAEYKELERLPFIKAFVYDDLNFDYDAAGLHIETYCRAYDEHGKMDHNVTCQKCTKCFNRSAKVIGCFAH